MKEYLKKVRECIKDLNLFVEVLQEITEKFSADEAQEFSEATLATSKEILVENNIPEIVEFLISPETYEGGMKIGQEDANLTLCQSIQDKALEICGDLNEESAILTLASFVLNDGLIEGVDTEKKVTYGVMFGLDEAHEKFAEETPVSVADYKSYKNFLLESKAPSDTIGLTILSKKYATFEEGNTSLNEALNEFGVNDRIYGVPVNEDYLSILSTETYSEEILDTLTEDYNLTEETVTEIKNRAEFLSKLESLTDEELFSLVEYPKAIELPVNLTEAVSEYLFGKKDNYLLELVSVVRDNKITKESMDKSVSKYKMFTKKSLEKLLQNLPEPSKEVTKEEEIPTEKTQEEKEELKQGTPFLENATEITESKPSTHNRLLDYYGDFSNNKSGLNEKSEKIEKRK